MTLYFGVNYYFLIMHIYELIFKQTKNYIFF